jgi:DnaJ-domain-containing protein 1
MHRGMQEDLKEAMSDLEEMLGDLAKGTLDPAKLAEMMKAMGMDPSMLASMMGQGRAPGFDPYQVLGLDKSASDEEVKKRYHDLLKKVHPDVGGTSFLVQIVIAAFEMIKRERGWQ